MAKTPSEFRDMSTTAPRRPRVCILTTYTKNSHPAWVSRVEVLQGWDEEYKRTDGRSFPVTHLVKRDLVWAWRIFRLSHEYDVVVTGNERFCLIFALLQVAFRRKRVPHVLIDCLWNWPASSWRRTLRRSLWRLVVSSVTRILVQSRCELDRYADALGVSREKFVFVPYHATVYDSKYSVSEGDYIFAGGSYNRDYETLIKVAEEVPCRVVIATLFADEYEGRRLPDNVSVRRVDHQEFLELMAGAKIVVVPLVPGLLHSGGQQTYENAMTMGKAVVVSDECSAADYILDGVTGLLVEPGDTAALSSAIQKLLDYPELRREMGRRAKEASEAFVPERFFDRVLAIVEDAAAGAGRKAEKQS
jgi:glycosyltransferase involved in cell wall biosynthesis